MTTLLSLMLLAAEPPVLPEVRPPPVPDFVTPVDYVAWFREQLRFADADNAYEDYRLFAEGGLQPDLPDELQRNMTSHLLYPRRWHTGQEPQLAQWLSGLALAMQACEDGSKRRYYAHGVTGQPQRLLDVELPGVLLGRLVSEARLIESWRLDVGLTLDDWLQRLLMVNRFANHLSQGVTLIEQLTAMSVKNRVYNQIAFMMRFAVLDDSQLRTLLQALQQEDGRPFNLHLLRALPAEEAMAFDLVQSQCLDAEGRVQPRLSLRPQAVEAWQFLAAQSGVTLPAGVLESASPTELAASIQQYMQAAASQIRQDPDCGLPEVLARLKQEYAGRSVILSLLIPNLERAANAALRTELTRRGTLVLVALSIKRRENRAWPDDLQAVAGLVPDALFTDPCAGQPLVYRRTGTRMQLYFVGRDGRDDGGHQEGMRYGGMEGEDLQIYPPVVKSR